MTSAVGRNAVNEMRIGFQGYRAWFANNETFPDGYRLNVSGFTNPVRNFMDQGRETRNLELSDSLTWVTGAHTFKVGGGARWTQVDAYSDAGLVPTYALGFGAGTPDPLVPGLFPGGISSDELSTASGLLGTLGGFVDEAYRTFNVLSTTSGFVDDATERRILGQNFVHLYAGDTWRITSDTSLTYGLRWELHTVPEETQGLALLPVGGAEAVLDPERRRGLRRLGKRKALLQQRPEQLRAEYRRGPATDRQAGRARRLRAELRARQQHDDGVECARRQRRPQPDRRAPGGRRHGQRRRAGSGRGARVQDSADRARRHPGRFHGRPVHVRIPTCGRRTCSNGNIGFQYQLLPDTAVEVRYVGNRGNDLIRAIDLNQLLLPDGFVEDFRRARRNLAANGDPRIGEALQVFPLLGFGGFLQSGGVQNWIRNGEIGQYIGGFLAPNRIFFFNGEGGERFGARLPISYFYTNPNTFVGDVVGNHSYSEYDALQLEVRRAWRAGFTAQFNYTWGQVLTDFGGSQSNFRAFFDNARPDLEVMRPGLRHHAHVERQLGLGDPRRRRAALDERPQAR